ncbi:MAG: hypothetical protein CMD90_00435 [Gammaproteobacteria bacterium]|nr:hypothetical protein [Gammaproteobacteria bacterium]
MSHYKDKAKKKYKILLIHGWGFHSSIWEAYLKGNFLDSEIVNLNLYDFRLESNNSFPEIAKIIVNSHKKFDLVLCWSLGCFLGREIDFIIGKEIKKIIFVSYLPRYIAEKNWEFGFQNEEILQLEKNIKVDFKKALKSFYLYSINHVNNKELAKYLFKNIKYFKEEDIKKLITTIEILKLGDYRKNPIKDEKKYLFIYGEEDRIAPCSVIKKIQSQHPLSSFATIKGAAHLPFVSHLREFSDIVNSFMRN